MAPGPAPVQDVATQTSRHRTGLTRVAAAAFVVAVAVAAIVIGSNGDQAGRPAPTKSADTTTETTTGATAGSCSPSPASRGHQLCSPPTATSSPGSR